MREFAGLYNDLDATTATTGKLYALKHYFGHAQPANAAWAVYFLAGGGGVKLSRRSYYPRNGS